MKLIFETTSKMQLILALRVEPVTKWWVVLFFTPFSEGLKCMLVMFICFIVIKFVKLTKMYSKHLSVIELSCSQSLTCVRAFDN